MNIRLILLIIIIFGFAIGCGAISYLSGGGTTLEQAYNNQQVDIIQKTAAGTVPHNVTITNNGSKPLIVDKGTILKSKDSQDLVLIDDKKISPGANDTVRAYCMEANEKAVPGATLTPAGYVSNQIKEIIDSSNPSDLQNATASQLQIWIITSNGQVDPFTGEAAALVQKQNIKYYQLREKLEAANTTVKTRFNLTDGELQTLSSTADSSTNAGSWVSDFRQWIKTTVGI
jgi:hypothetical protein